MCSTDEYQETESLNKRKPISRLTKESFYRAALGRLYIKNQQNGTLLCIKSPARYSFLPAAPEIIGRGSIIASTPHKSNLRSVIVKLNSFSCARTLTSAARPIFIYLIKRSNIMAGPEYQEEAHSVDKNNITPRPAMQSSESSGAAPERARVCASYLRRRVQKKR